MAKTNSESNKDCNYCKEGIVKTITVSTVKDEASSHFDIDSVSIEITDTLISEIAKAVPRTPGTHTVLYIRSDVAWKHKGFVADESIGFEELIIYNSGNLIISGTGKHCSSVIQSEIFQIEKVQNVIEAKKKVSVVDIEVVLCGFNQFDSHERNLLIRHADLLSTSDIEHKTILYSDSLQGVLDEIEEESINAPILEGFIKDALLVDADQYIFD